MTLSDNVFWAFVFTTFAGLSTLLGAVFLFILPKRYSKLLPLGLGFSAGIMLYLSFFDLLGEAKSELLSFGMVNVRATVFVFFLLGLFIAGIIDIFTHRYANFNLIGKNGMGGRCGRSRRHIGRGFEKKQLLMRAGLFTAIALGLHNFPEGIATFSATTVNTSFGLSIAIAIAIHNIPEGFCVALPVYHATGSYKKSFFYVIISALAEPLGALITFLFLYPLMTEYIMGGILAMVAGIMTYVSLDSLLPTAKKMGDWHSALFSLIVGMVAMFLLSSFVL